MQETRFDFGNNWYDFLGNLKQEQIDIATEELKRLVGNLTNKSFVDIGSGSGLHSLAAFNLGATKVESFDYDTMSVKATQALLTQYASNKPWNAVQGDILAPPAVETLFDVVYSYGVLHHTGDMWTAIENASAFCKKGGIFALALYVKTPFCGFWKKEKRFYSRHRLLRPLLDTLLFLLIFIRRIIAGENPFKYISEYKSKRGMNFFTDLRDWLGGYPYESVADEELQTFMSSLGFTLVDKHNTTPGIGLLGTSCGEWVFQKET